MLDIPTFLSIRDVAKRGPLPEYTLRKMQKAGTLPGIYAGNRFLVNWEAFIEQLHSESESRGKIL